MSGHSVELVSFGGVTLWKGTLTRVPRVWEYVQLINGDMMQVKHVVYVMETACTFIELRELKSKPCPAPRAAKEPS